MKPGIRRLIEELCGARVLVIHPRDAEGEALIDQLRRIGCNVQRRMAAAADDPARIDTVFQIVETRRIRFSRSSSEARPAYVVAIVDYENPTILKRLLDSNAHGVVNKPIRPSASCHRWCWPDRCAGTRGGWKARCRSSRRR